MDFLCLRGFLKGTILSVLSEAYLFKEMSADSRSRFIIILLVFRFSTKNQIVSAVAGHRQEVPASATTQKI